MEPEINCSELCDSFPGQELDRKPIHDLCKTTITSSHHSGKTISSLSPVLLGIVWTLLSCGLLLMVFFLGFTIRCRKNRIVKMSSPNLNIVTLLGSCLTYSSAYLFGIRDRDASGGSSMETLIQVRLSMLCIGTSLVFGPILGKSWRLYKVFTQRVPDKRVIIKDLQLLGLVAALVIADVILLMTWVLTDPIQCLQILGVSMTVTGREVSCSLTGTHFCASRYSDVWIALVLGCKGLLLLYGAYLAGLTDHVSSPPVNQSLTIMVGVNLVVLAAGLLFVVTRYLHSWPNLVFGLTSGGIFVCTTTINCLIFIPQLKQWKAFEEENQTIRCMAKYFSTPSKSYPTQYSEEQNCHARGEKTSMERLLTEVRHNKWMSKCSSSASKEDGNNEATFQYLNKQFLGHNACAITFSAPRIPAVCPKTIGSPPCSTAFDHQKFQKVDLGSELGKQLLYHQRMRGAHPPPVLFPSFMPVISVRVDTPLQLAPARPPGHNLRISQLTAMQQKNAVIESLQEQVNNAKEKLVRLMSAECTYDPPDWAVFPASSHSEDGQAAAPVHGLATQRHSLCLSDSQNDTSAATQDSQTTSVPSPNAQSLKGPGKDSGSSPGQKMSDLKDFSDHLNLGYSQKPQAEQSQGAEKRDQVPMASHQSLKPGEEGPVPRKLGHLENSGEPPKRLSRVDSVIREKLQEVLQDLGLGPEAPLPSSPSCPQQLWKSSAAHSTPKMPLPKELGFSPHMVRRRRAVPRARSHFPGSVPSYVERQANKILSGAKNRLNVQNRDSLCLDPQTADLRVSSSKKPSLLSDPQGKPGTLKDSKQCQPEPQGAGRSRAAFPHQPPGSGQAQCPAGPPLPGASPDLPEQQQPQSPGSPGCPSLSSCNYLDTESSSSDEFFCHCHRPYCEICFQSSSDSSDSGSSDTDFQHAGGLASWEKLWARSKPVVNFKDDLRPTLV